MFTENAPPLYKAYYESWRKHAETSGPGSACRKRAGGGQGPPRG